jgi:hypothetical protein
MKIASTLAALEVGFGSFFILKWHANYMEQPVDLWLSIDYSSSSPSSLQFSPLNLLCDYFETHFMDYVDCSLSQRTCCYPAALLLRSVRNK